MALPPSLAQSLKEKSIRIDQALEAFLRDVPKQVDNLHEAALYALGLDQENLDARGKRIRPALCLVACEALGGDVEAAIPFAVAVELMHNFFLVHDDIQDGDRFRRGRPSIWVRHGLSHAVNIGDYMFTRLFSAVLPADDSGIALSPEMRLRLLRLLVDTLERTHTGQAQDMNARDMVDYSIDDYMECVVNKTGYYLAAPMLGGAIIAGADQATLDALTAFGQHVGPVFQIVDDTIDLTHGKGRESIGSDIREGKRSYLVAYTASQATPEERDELFGILDLPREETTPDHVARVAALFEKYQAVAAGRACCEELMQKARADLADCPALLRGTLIAIFDDMLERKK